jgi:hypothetical protein
MQQPLIPISAVIDCSRDVCCDALVVERDDRFEGLIDQLIEHLEDMLSHPSDSNLALLTNVFSSALDKDDVYRWIVDDMWRRVDTNQDLLGTSTYSTREQHCMDRMRNFRDLIESHCIASNSV